MKKKLLTIMLATTMALSCTACGSSSPSESKATTESKETEEKVEKEYVDDINAVVTNPDSYKGKYIKFCGIVSSVESDEDAYGLQVYVDLDYNNSVLVEVPKSLLPEIPKSDDFLNIDAKIDGSYSGQTVMGVDSAWARLTAESVEKTTYVDSFGKADTTWDFTDKVIDQNGMKVEVTKVEFAKDETRFYVTATNNSSATMTLWTYSAKVIQNGQQLEQSYANYYANYPELSSDLLPGASSSGVLVFDAMEPSEMQLYLDGTTDNWEIEFSPFTFDLVQ